MTIILYIIYTIRCFIGHTYNLYIPWYPAYIIIDSAYTFRSGS